MIGYAPVQEVIRLDTIRIPGSDPDVDMGWRRADDRTVPPGLGA